MVVHLSPAPQAGVREDLDPPAAQRSKQLEPVVYLSLFQVHDKHQMAHLKDIFQDIKLLWCLVNADGAASNLTAI